MIYNSDSTKVFISYHHEYDQWAKDYLARISRETGCFEDKSVNTGDIADDGRSSQAIREIIRDEYLRDTEVTVLLCGAKTIGRKHIDWELKSSMINANFNCRSGILIILLPSADTGNYYISMYGEKQAIYPDVPDIPGSWIAIDRKSDFERRWPDLPARVLDNLVKPDVQISVVQWERIVNSPQKLKWLIDNAAVAGRANPYDMSRPMRRRNAPLQTNALSSLLSAGEQPQQNALATLLGEHMAQRRR